MPGKIKEVELRDHENITNSDPAMLGIKYMRNFGKQSSCNSRNQIEDGYSNLDSSRVADPDPVFELRSDQVFKKLW